MGDNQQLNHMCEQGQQLLTKTRYLEALHVLREAELLAWQSQRWEMLWRLYMPLQETRRQIRQRCGEGQVCLDLLASDPDKQPQADEVLRQFSAGQLLVAGWGNIDPAKHVRRHARERGLYLETFLGAAYPGVDGRLVVLVPTDSTVLPPVKVYSRQALAAALPPKCLVLAERELPHGVHEGTPGTYACVMDLWEQLHQPFLAEADAREDLVERMQGYRQTIEVDSACELAHQRLSDTARQMARR